MQAWSCEKCEPDVRKECMKAVLKKDVETGDYVGGEFALPKCENRLLRSLSTGTINNMGRVQQVIETFDNPVNTLTIIEHCGGMSEDVVRSALENLRRDGRVYSRQIRGRNGAWFYFREPLDGFELVPSKQLETVKRIAEARAKGLSIRESAKELGVCMATVAKYSSLARRFGLL